jgi:hypothetical protein
MSADIELVTHGPREDRVVAFERLTDRLDQFATDKPELVSFELGYLASRIAPGMIRHSSILGRIGERFPTAMLWYGFCSGIPEGDYDLSIPSRSRTLDLPVSARRIIRELLRPEAPIGAPVCDIGYSELLALSLTEANPADGLVRATPGLIVVELLHGVCVPVNVFSSPQARTTAGRSIDSEIISSLRSQVDRLSLTLRELQNMAPWSDSQQGQLFTPRRKRR